MPLKIAGVELGIGKNGEPLIGVGGQKPKDIPGWLGFGAKGVEEQPAQPEQPEKPKFPAQPHDRREMQNGVIGPGMPVSGKGGFRLDGSGGGVTVGKPKDGLRPSARPPVGKVGPHLTPPAKPVPPVDQTRPPKPKLQKPPNAPPAPILVPDQKDNELFSQENLNNLQGWSNSIADAVRRGNPVDKAGRAAWMSLNQAQQAALNARNALQDDPENEEAQRRFAIAQDAYRKAARAAMQGYGGVQTKPSQPLPQRDTEAFWDLFEGNGKKVIRNSKEAKDRIRYAAAPEKTSYIIASSNTGDTGENTAGHGTRMGVARGLSNATTPRHQISAEKAGQFIQRHTDVMPKSTSAYGEWADGDEDSVIHALPGQIPQEQLEKAAANIGYTQGQKSVLTFTPHDDGQHLMSSVHVTDQKPEESIRELRAVGIPFRTVVPHPDGTHTVHLFDDFTHESGPSASEKLHAWASQNGYQAVSQPGTGRFVGDWNHRILAKKAYIGIDPSLKPGSDRPYADRMVMTSKDTETKIRYAATSIAQQSPESGNLKVITRYLTDLQKSDPEKFAKILNQHDVHGREIHYKWLDSLGDGTLTLIKKLAQSHQDAGATMPKGASASLGRLAKQVLGDPTKHRTSLRELHHQLIKSGFYQPGVRPVWPDHERMLEVSGKLKQSGRLGELDQYLQSVQQGKPMIDREETPVPAAPEEKPEGNGCPGCTGGMAEQVARLSARGIKVQLGTDKV